MDTEEEIKALVRALLDKDAIVAGGVLYCTSVMLRAATALTAGLDDREDAERYRWLRDCTASLYHYVTCWTGGKEKESMNIDAGVNAARRSHG